MCEAGVEFLVSAFVSGVLFFLSPPALHIRQSNTIRELESWRRFWRCLHPPRPGEQSLHVVGSFTFRVKKTRPWYYS